MPQFAHKTRWWSARQHGYVDLPAGQSVTVVPTSQLQQAAGRAEAAALQACARRMQVESGRDVVFVYLGGRVRCLFHDEIVA